MRGLMVRNRAFSEKEGLDVLGFVKRNQSPVMVLILAVFLYFVYSRFLKWKDEPKAPNQNNDSQVIKENTKGATISDQEALMISEGLFEAFNVVGGTDEDRVYELLKGLSLSDYNKVYNAFGLRAYNYLFGESTLALIGQELSLTQWLVNELDKDELKKLKLLNPNLPIR